MKTRSKADISEIFLVIAGFIAWVASGILFDGRVDQPSGISNLSGAFIFFLIAFFVQERPRGGFVDRSQVLGVAAFMLWLGLNQLIVFGENRLGASFDSTPATLLVWVASLAAPFAFYWGSTFLIRGFYADPDYKKDQDESGPAE